jgi:hypothetical protein
MSTYGRSIAKILNEKYEYFEIPESPLRGLAVL